MPRVMLVEDTDDLRFLFARALRYQGCEVCEAAGALEALDVVEAFGPEIVLTDLMMPEVDGVELIRRLALIPSLSRVPVVVVTADCTAESERRAREAGAVDFLIKPVEVERVVGRLEAYRAKLGGG